MAREIRIVIIRVHFHQCGGELRMHVGVSHIKESALSSNEESAMQPNQLTLRKLIVLVSKTQGLSIQAFGTAL
jgi:hypothetical protein